jgi:hypothetical protein
LRELGRKGHWLDIGKATGCGPGLTASLGKVRRIREMVGEAHPQFGFGAAVSGDGVMVVVYPIWRYDAAALAAKHRP